LTRRISLSLVLHNHQPVGNFGWVIEEVFGQAYEPMVGALERHPRVRVGLHYTGPLLEWIDEHRPDFIDRLRGLVARGQVEILGGAHFEPVLVALPERDRHGQLIRMRADLERRFGVAPAGAWLAERVWEPSLPHDLAAAGYGYTVLDDNHLRAAAVAEDAMWGTYTTDDQGRLLTIFGTEQGLRYRIPFRPVDELIEYLRQNATEDGRRLGTMGDDGEKFGAWPGTDEHCWGRNRWVDDCFDAIEENADWLTTVTPSQWLSREPPIGRIYVPASSYVEMTEWALPPDEANVFHRLLAAARDEQSVAARFLRGGMWRNFQARYREVNDLHKQMLRVSQAVAEMPAGELQQRALDHLYRGQSNDCYWHGLFGGIYIVHMRMATLSELIAAEDLARAGGPSVNVGDHDLDGVDEVLLCTDGQAVLVDPAEGGGIGAWDLRASRVAMASVMRRRPEAYHEQLRAMEQAEAQGRTGEGKTATSIHDQLMSKEKGLSALLVYDRDERRSGLVRLLDAGAADAAPADLAALRYEELGSSAGGEWTLEEVGQASITLMRRDAGLELRKTIMLGFGRLDPTLEIRLDVDNRDGLDVDAQLALEFNLNLLGGGGNPAAYYRWPTGESRHDERGDLAPGIPLAFGNEHSGVEVTAVPEPPARQTWYPIETVSNSEAGFERVYQGSCLLLRWPLRLSAGERRSFGVRFEITQAADLARDEGGRLAPADGPLLERV
jgi:4-alpha-glucanotransferase